MKNVNETQQSSVNIKDYFVSFEDIEKGLSKKVLFRAYSVHYTEVFPLKITWSFCKREKNFTSSLHMEYIADSLSEKENEKLREFINTYCFTKYEASIFYKFMWEKYNVEVWFKELPLPFSSTDIIAEPDFTTLNSFPLFDEKDDMPFHIWGQISVMEIEE